MCYIGDEDIGTDHYSKRSDNVFSKALCLMLFYIIADRAHLIYPHSQGGTIPEEGLRVVMENFRKIDEHQPTHSADRRFRQDAPV
jgi:hypothetical protein